MLLAASIFSWLRNATLCVTNSFQFFFTFQRFVSSFDKLLGHTAPFDLDRTINQPPEHLACRFKIEHPVGKSVSGFDPTDFKEDFIGFAALINNSLSTEVSNVCPVTHPSGGKVRID